MKRHLRNTTGVVAISAVFAASGAGFAQDDAPSVLDNPALSELNPDCRAVIALLEETPGSDIANMPTSAIEALEPGSRECVLAVQDLLQTAPPPHGAEEAAAPAADQEQTQAEAEAEVVTPEAQAEALSDSEAAPPAVGEADEQAADDAPADAPVEPTEEQAQGTEDTGEATDTAPLVSEADEAAPEAEVQTEATESAAPEAEAPAEAADAPVADDGTVETTEADSGTPEVTAEDETAAHSESAEEVAEEEIDAAEGDAAQDAAEGDAAQDDAAQDAASAEAAETADEQTEAAVDEAAATESASGEEELEVVQEDTELAAEAANEQVTAEAAAAASADTSGEATAEEPEMTTEVVTEENSRSSSEEFAATSQMNATSGSRNADSDDGGLNIGQIAAGVLGGIVLNEILRPQEKVVENTGDRVVVQRPNGEYYVMKDDNALLRQPGTELQTQTFSDGSTRQIALREDGTRIETIRAANGRVLRRAKYTPDGREVLLFDDTAEFEPVEVSRLPNPVIERVDPSELEEDALRQALAAEEAQRAGRRFSLSQVRNIRAVRNLVPIIELESVTFDTGSAAIRPSEAEELAAIGRILRDLIAENPDEVFLIEGHTDATGGAAMNLALSDRRAESVALALTEYFDVPPENMVVQGYGESNLKVQTPAAERQNRRAAVRRITPLLRTASAQ